MQHGAIAPDVSPTAPVDSGMTAYQGPKGASGRDSMDSATIYEIIETFGLTEIADDLPIPQDDVLLSELQGTGLHGETEPLGTCARRC